jgi:UDPglucose 6-dehydrogenase
MGHEVHVFDTDTDKIALLQRGGVPIHEPGLGELIAATGNSIHFWVSDGSWAAELGPFDVFYIAVGTPRGFHGNADISYVRSAAEWIRDTRDENKPSLVIIKSTVPPGTAKIVREILDGENPPSVISNPEFLKEGTAICDFMNPDRVIVGCLIPDSPVSVSREISRAASRACSRFMEIYANSDIAPEKFHIMGNESAELAKYASNGMLATRISFMNEMSRVAHAVGADIDDVERAVGADSRIGTKFLHAGPGWGGSCFPKDLQALANMAEDDLPVVDGASRTNGIQMTYVAERCLRLLWHPARGSKCAIWGAAFKPNTDDTRNSPVLTIAAILTARGVEVTIHDPVAHLSPGMLSSLGAEQVEDMYDAARGAHLLVLLTDWSDYLDADWPKLVGEMDDEGVIFDTRNALRGKVIADIEPARLQRF